MRGQEKRFVLFTPWLDSVAYQALNELNSIAKGYYLTEEKIKNIVKKLAQKGWKYEERYHECIKAILHYKDQNQKFYVLKAGRTIKEVVNEIWTWFKRYKDKKIHIQMKLLDEHYFDGDHLDYEILKMFRHVRKEGYGYTGYFNGKKKQIDNIVHEFLYDVLPVEYSYFSENYYEGWRLIEIDTKLILWKYVGVRSDESEGSHIYFEVVE